MLNGSLILRIGLAFSFFYAATRSFMNPLDWVGFFPGFTSNIINPMTALSLFSSFEILLGIWLLSGYKVKIPAFIAFGLLLGLVIFNLSLMDILFRDVSLAFAALALAFYAS